MRVVLGWLAYVVVGVFTLYMLGTSLAPTGRHRDGFPGPRAIEGAEGPAGALYGPG